MRFNADVFPGKFLDFPLLASLIQPLQPLRAKVVCCCLCSVRAKILLQMSIHTKCLKCHSSVCPLASSCSPHRRRLAMLSSVKAFFEKYM